MEDLTLDKMDKLLKNETWTRQVLLIQSYIPTVSIQTGNYSHAPQVGIIPHSSTFISQMLCVIRSHFAAFFSTGSIKSNI